MEVLSCNRESFPPQKIPRSYTVVVKDPLQGLLNWRGKITMDGGTTESHEETKSSAAEKSPVPPKRPPYIVVIFELKVTMYFLM